MKTIWNKGNYGLILWTLLFFIFHYITQYVETKYQILTYFFSNSNSTRSERIKSEGDIKITKGKNNITVGKKCTLISDSTNDNEAEATMLTQVIEHDHNEDARKCVLSKILFLDTTYICDENDLK